MFQGYDAGPLKLIALAAMAIMVGFGVYAMLRPKPKPRDSHAESLLEHPHYTRPAEFRGWRVPDVLLSGNHAEIALWRRRQALLRTLRWRPDLLETASLTSEDREYLDTLRPTCNGLD